MKTKDEAFSMFLKWKTLAENQIGKRIERLRTDNNLEFYHNEFKQFCFDSRIARHYTYTHTPQQNGLAERINQIIIEKVRYMLNESGLPQKFWAEVASTDVI